MQFVTNLAEAELGSAQPQLVSLFCRKLTGSQYLMVLSLVRFKSRWVLPSLNPADHSKKTNYNITILHMRQKWQSSNWVNTNMTYCKYTNEKETKYKAKETRYKMVIYKMMIHKMKNLKRTQRRQIAKLLSQWKFYILLSVQPGCL